MNRIILLIFSAFIFMKVVPEEGAGSSAEVPEDYDLSALDSFDKEAYSPLLEALKKFHPSRKEVEAMVLKASPSEGGSATGSEDIAEAIRGLFNEMVYNKHGDKGLELMKSLIDEKGEHTEAGKKYAEAYEKHSKAGHLAPNHKALEELLAGVAEGAEAGGAMKDAINKEVSEEEGAASDMPDNDSATEKFKNTEEGVPASDTRQRIKNSWGVK